MPTCELCDGESFYDKDGLFYCIGCNTQSQDVQVEMKQEVDVEHYSIDTATLGLKTTVRKKRRVKHYDLGKPWVVYEGFQYMIKGLVESLIDMGFNEKLKDCVGKLWFSYLKLKKVAFCHEEPETISLAAHSKRRMNEGVLPKSIKKQRGLTKKEEEVAFQKEDSTMGDSLDLYKEIDILDKLRFPSDEEMNVDESEDSNEENNCGSIGSIKLPEKHSSMFEMKQHLTLCFCYLGLVLLQEPVFLSDLIRWTHEGMIPYHTASRVLPPQMKFASGDYRLFCNRKKLSVSKLTDPFRILCCRLSITSLHGKEYLKLLVASLVVDLGFSNSVQTLGWYLVDVDFDKKRETCREYVTDGLVSSYVIVALKLIYFLDDHHEMKNEVRTSLLGLLKLPAVENWKKWVTRSMLKHKKKLYNGIPRDKKDLKYMRDLSVFEDYCTKDVFKNFNTRATTRSYRKTGGAWNSEGTDPHEQYFKQFYSVAQVLNPSLDFDRIKRVATSFPLSVDHLGEVIRCDLHRDVTVGNTSCMRDNISNEALNDGDKKQASSRVTEEIGNTTTPLSSNTKHDIELSSAGESTGKQLDNETNIKFFTDGDPPIPCQRSDVTEHESCLNNTSREVIDSNKYLYYSDEQDEESWNSSYRYLLEVISRRMEMTPSELQHDVRKLEHRYFGAQIKFPQASHIS